MLYCFSLYVNQYKDALTVLTNKTPEGSLRPSRFSENVL